MRKNTTDPDQSQFKEATVPRILRLPQELREIVIAVISGGDLTVQQLSASTVKDDGECQRRLDELVEMGHLEEHVSGGQIFYRATHRTRPRKRELSLLT